MRILIAEDDQVLADGLLRTLRGNGYAVDHVASGSEADAALSTQEFDLLILDLGLPRLHGFDVLKKLRARGSATPVLILTAADSVEQRVKGLDLGADDYMAKPFSLQELEARVRALARRGMGVASNVIKHGPLTFDTTGRVAYIHDTMVELSARELGLLEVLLQRAGRAPVRVGRRGEQQRHRGLHPPPAQEDRAGTHPHRHGARLGVLPGEDPWLSRPRGRRAAEVPSARCSARCWIGCWCPCCCCGR
jgi:two-component system OmpR family response regulator